MCPQESPAASEVAGFNQRMPFRESREAKFVTSALCSYKKNPREQWGPSVLSVTVSVERIWQLLTSSMFLCYKQNGHTKVTTEALTLEKLIKCRHSIEKQKKQKYDCLSAAVSYLNKQQHIWTTLGSNTWDGDTSSTTSLPDTFLSGLLVDKSVLEQGLWIDWNTDTHRQKLVHLLRIYRILLCKALFLSYFCSGLASSHGINYYKSIYSQDI